jgi:hypothetical protein
VFVQPGPCRTVRNFFQCKKILQGEAIVSKKTIKSLRFELLT